MKPIMMYHPAPAGPGAANAGPAIGLYACPTGNRSHAFGKINAIAGVVIRELYRRKDFYVLFILTALITLLLGSVSFFQEDKIVRYVKEICLFLIWVSSLVVVITTASRQIPAEREQRTVFPLLAKPVTRTQILLGKFWGCWLAGGMALLVFYLFFAVLSGAREHTWPLANYLQAGLLHWMMLGIVIAMALAGSLLFAAPSSTNTILFIVVAAILLVGRHLNQVALQLDQPLQTIVYAIYFALPHLELFDMRDLVIHNWNTVPWLVWFGAVAYGAVYIALFLAAGCLLFRRKPLN